MTRRLRPLLMLLVAHTVCAHAHDMWIERAGTQYTLYYGHRHEGHEAPALVRYRPEVVLSALCLDERGEKAPVETSFGYPWRMTGQCAMSYVDTSSGYWTKTPYGTKNVPRSEAHLPLRSWLAHESVKRLDAWNDAFAQPLTSDLEVVPLENPLALGPGDSLHLRVTFQGKPAPGVAIAYEGHRGGETGSDGTLDVPLLHGGLQLFEASLRRPLHSDKADEAIYTATLCFELRPRQ